MIWRYLKPTNRSHPKGFFTVNSSVNLFSLFIIEGFFRWWTTKENIDWATLFHNATSWFFYLSGPGAALSLFPTWYIHSFLLPFTLPNFHEIVGLPDLAKKYTRSSLTQMLHGTCLHRKAICCLSEIKISLMSYILMCRIWNHDKRHTPIILVAEISEEMSQKTETEHLVRWEENQVRCLLLCRLAGQRYPDNGPRLF